MPSNWSKGFTKGTHPSVQKISETMKRRKIDNFAKWRQKMRASGEMISSYPEFEKNGDLAELIGVVLGDGHLSKFPRTEELSIFSNSNNPGFVKRYSNLIGKIFSKEPAIGKHGSGCIRIRVYQKKIADRLGVPYSPRAKKKIVIPDWILANNEYIVRYLRGLYEAEGCHCVHEKTSTYKVFFSNHNTSMLKNVFKLVKKLGFHPHESKYQVQILRKEEVFRFLDLIQFRKY